MHNFPLTRDHPPYNRAWKSCSVNLKIDSDNYTIHSVFDLVGLNHRIYSIDEDCRCVKDGRGLSVTTQLSSTMCKEPQRRLLNHDACGVHLNVCMTVSTVMVVVTKSISDVLRTMVMEAGDLK